MSLMGLMDSAFWLSWLLWEVLLVFISSMLIVLFGMMFQFDFFLNNSFGILFFLFFLFQFNMVYNSFLLWPSHQKLSSLSFSGQTQSGLSYADPFLSNVLMADRLKMWKDWICFYVVNFDKQFCISQDSWFWCLHNRILDIGKRSISSIKMYNVMAWNINGSSYILLLDAVDHNHKWISL